MGHSQFEQDIIPGFDVGDPVDGLATKIMEANMDPKSRSALNESALGTEIRKSGNSLAK